MSSHRAPIRPPPRTLHSNNIHSWPSFLSSASSYITNQSHYLSTLQIPPESCPRPSSAAIVLSPNFSRIEVKHAFMTECAVVLNALSVAVEAERKARYKELLKVGKERAGEEAWVGKLLLWKDVHEHTYLRPLNIQRYIVLTAVRPEGKASSPYLALKPPVQALLRVTCMMGDDMLLRLGVVGTSEELDAAKSTHEHSWSTDLRKWKLGCVEALNETYQEAVRLDVRFFGVTTYKETLLAWRREDGEVRVTGPVKSEGSGSCTFREVLWYFMHLVESEAREEDQ